MAVARNQITIAAINDGKGEKGEKGEAAELYRLTAVEETANVTPAGVLYVSLSYGVQHIQGGKVEDVGNLNDFRVVCETDTHDSTTVEKGWGFVCRYTMNDYLANSNRPSFFRVQLFRGDELLDERVVNIQLEAASYVEVVGDLRRTVSQQGSSISSVQQDAKSLTLKVESLKNGVRNLLKGGQLNRTISRAFAMVNDGELTVKLKPETDYTLTVNGRISSSAWDKRQMLRTYIFDKSWKGFMVNCDIQATSDTTNSVTFRIPKDKASVDNTYCFNCYSFPNQLPQGKNGEVTVNWITLTEGSQPASDWIPSKEESGEERVKSVELKLENGEFRITNDKTVFVDNSGKETVLIKDGKLSAELIDAVKIIAAGIQAQEIDAKEAKFKNLTVTGNSTFDGTINTNKGTIAGWKILPGMIGYGKNSDGLTLFDNCLIYNYKGTKRQVILGEDPLGKFAGRDMMLSLKNEPRSDFEKVGIFLDIHPDPTFGWKNNHAILSLRGTYGGFRRSLKVISENYSLGLGDSSILFVSLITKTFTLPSSPEDGEEFTIYSVHSVDINFTTTDNIPIEKLFYLNGIDDDIRHTFRVVYSKITNKWYVFLM